MKPKPEFAYPLHELIQKRWSPRAFADKPVSEETMRTLLEAARWAASSGNGQPWRFIYAHHAETERFARLAGCLAGGNMVWAQHAPVLGLTLAQTVNDKNEPNRWSFYDLGLAMGNLTTQATAVDLYLHQMAGFSVEKARETFALPAHLEPVTMFALGYLGDPEQLPEPFKGRETAPQQRKPLDELILHL